MYVLQAQPIPKTIMPKFQNNYNLFVDNCSCVCFWNTDAEDNITELVQVLKKITSMFFSAETNLMVHFGHVLRKTF